jgi:hypothetical protein
MPDKYDVLDAVDTMVSRFLYYNRKEDEDLPLGVIERLVREEELTIEEIVDPFQTLLHRGIRL